MLQNLQAALEYLAGERDDAPAMLNVRYLWVLRCAACALALVLIYAFSGQSSKFIYIDF